MKKIISAIAVALLALTVTAQEQQEQAVRTMRIFHDGNVIYTRNVSLVDSINFVINKDDEGGEEAKDTIGQMYVGVVAFNQNVYQLPITNDLEAAKMFIRSQVNDKDFTAFAYSVSKGNLMFDAEGLPAFDKIFMLNFSDGTDNYSNRKWGDEGRMVSQSTVYDTARYDLSQRAGLESYAIGFGNDAGFKEKMSKILMGKGSYHNAVSAQQLKPTFIQIANSIIASSKNVVLKTNSGYYQAGDKYFRFTFTAEGGLQDTIIATMEGTPANGFTLNVAKEGKYARFDYPASGEEEESTGKVLIPLNNLKFVFEGEEVQFDFNIEISFNGELYYEDVEEASKAEAISKRLAVILVLDCSTSMADAFKPMQDAAIDFIETLEVMDPSDDDEDNTKFDSFSESLNSVSFAMNAVEGGSFVMGAQSAGSALPNYDPDAEKDEQPTRNVTLSDFYIGETEVTQELWEYVMGAHNVTHYPTGAEPVYLYPAFDSSGSLVATGGKYMYGGSSPSSSYGDGDNYPVYYVSYYDIVGEHGFLDRLNALTGKNYRLPTEEEWEYAARGGQKNQYTRETTDATGAPSSATMYVYSGSNTISDVAWYYYNTNSGCNPVKTKTANDLGTYDMSGNVCEWCATTSTTYGIVRGGSSRSDAKYCRVSTKSNSTSLSSRNYTIGFRLVLSR